MTPVIRYRRLFKSFSQSHLVHQRADVQEKQLGRFALLQERYALDEKPEKAQTSNYDDYNHSGNARTFHGDFLRSLSVRKPIHSMHCSCIIQKKRKVKQGTARMYASLMVLRTEATRRPI